MVRFLNTVYREMRGRSPIGKPGRWLERSKGEPTGRKISTRLSPVGFRVEKWRKKYGIEPDELASIAGISVPAYGRFLRGKQTLTFDELSAMAHAFGITVDVMTRYAPWEVPRD